MSVMGRVGAGARAVAKAEAKADLPLDRIIARKSPDVALAADDILYVPDAKGRRLSVSAIEKITGFGAATTSSKWRGTGSPSVR